jgi:hypothetical protein
MAQIYNRCKRRRNFNAFTELKQLEFKVPMVCLVVSLHRDRR